MLRFDQPFRDSHPRVAGVDEAGRGPWAGPVVAAAVILPERPSLPHLADSKQLTPAQRWRLYQAIQRQAVAIGVGLVSSAAIDQINILQATYTAMRLALARLWIPPDFVLVDGFPIPRVGLPQCAIVHGDARSASIAAASIVAKVTRDQLMRRLDHEYPGYAFARHKGYGTRAHRRALARLGPSPIHRFTFAPVRGFAHE